MTKKIIGLIIVSIFILNLYPMGIIGEVSVFQNDQGSINSESNENRFQYKFDASLQRPITFTPNRGQLENNAVRFYSKDGGVWFTDDGMWLELREEIPIEGRESRSLESRVRSDPMIYQEQLKPIQYRRAVIKQEFVGANLVRPEGRQRLSWNSNFFYGNDSTRWCTGVPNYGEVYYEHIYDGIDLRYYTDNNGLKYDFIVHPGADPSQIRVKVDGADGIEVNEFGDLEIRTGIKNIVDRDLFVYQESNGQRRQVDSRFCVLNENKYGFDLIGEFDPQRTLIIDPTLEYSTYVGGDGYEYSFDIAVDDSENAFITGYTQSHDFPNTTGALDIILNGTNDIFVSKLNHNGSQLIFSTFIGGSLDDRGNAIEVNTLGEAFVTGRTDSTDFPVTKDALNSSNNGNRDIVCVKLYPNGSKLIYSTYIGGSGSDYAYDIAIDPYGDAYVTGNTQSLDFPTTKNAFDNSSSVNQDGFVLKLNNNGSKLNYSTYIRGNQADYIINIETNSKGEAFITGLTSSSDFPTTPGAKDTSFNGNFGTLDCFITKLNHNGSKLNYSTFIGGVNDDGGYGLKLDLEGNAVVTGYTDSDDFPTTPRAYCTQKNSGDVSVFVLKLNESGSKIVCSTFLDGTSDDSGIDLKLDTYGKIFVTGTTGSYDFPVTPDAYAKHIQDDDVFLAQLNSNCSTLLYSTCLGGLDTDTGSGIDIDSKGNVFITGHTSSTDFPTSKGAFNITHNNRTDVFVSKFSFPVGIRIGSLELIKNDVVMNKIYSMLGLYTFRVNITDSISLIDLEFTQLNLDPQGLSIQLRWDRATGQFKKLNDPNNYLTLEQSCIAYNNGRNNWTIDFNVTFNWTYPDENLHDVKVYASSEMLPPAWLNMSNMYRVENDLVFTGNLEVRYEEDLLITGSSIIRGGEKLTFSGLIPAYQSTTDIYPTDSGLKVTIWGDNGRSWFSSPVPGQPIDIEITTPYISDSDGFTYTINLTGIPPYCDATSESFTIKLDSENVTYSNPTPDNTTWHTDTDVAVGIAVLDTGGGFVDASSIEYSTTTDNGSIWNVWQPGATNKDDEASVSANGQVTLKDGRENLVKWQAGDTVGNGPIESEPYRILIDTQYVIFSDNLPSQASESPTETVEVGITISDETSGVDAASVEYAISTDGGGTWEPWLKVHDLVESAGIDVKLNITFANGTENHIKWRAVDIAGNGPTESKIYNIKVNTWLDAQTPKVKLLAPKSGAVIAKKSIELKWELTDMGFTGIRYDILLDTVNPPKKSEKTDHSETTLLKTGLTDGTTYYWTVVPKTGSTNGRCLSGVWSFSVNLSIPVPQVTLQSPLDGVDVNTSKPILKWSVTYAGTEAVTYNIHIWSDDGEESIIESISGNKYSVEKDLENGKTYYWKIVPFAGDIEGPDSATWSFKVVADIVPKFDLAIVLNESVVELHQGEEKIVKATVENLGEANDIVLLTLETTSKTGIDIRISGNASKPVDVDGFAEFSVVIKVGSNTKPGEIQINVSVNSTKAKEYGLEVKRNTTLTIRVLKDKDGSIQESDSNAVMIGAAVGVIILIIILCMLYFFYFRKNGKKDRLYDLPPPDGVPATSEYEFSTPQPARETMEEMPKHPQQENKQQYLHQTPRHISQAPHAQPHYQHKHSKPPDPGR